MHQLGELVCPTMPHQSPVMQWVALLLMAGEMELDDL